MGLDAEPSNNAHEFKLRCSYDNNGQEACLDPENPYT